jgi:hypothetical protein
VGVGVTSRLVVASLLSLALVSGVVIAESERNYASVADRDRTTATVVDATADRGGIVADLLIHNSMNEPLRIRYVSLRSVRANVTDSASTPFREARTLPPGETTLQVGIPARQVAGNVSGGETARIGGTVVVVVYNGYEFEIPIEEREVTL